MKAGGNTLWWSTPNSSPRPYSTMNNRCQQPSLRRHLCSYQVHARYHVTGLATFSWHWFLYICCRLSPALCGEFVCINLSFGEEWSGRLGTKRNCRMAPASWMLSLSPTFALEQACVCKMMWSVSTDLILDVRLSALRCFKASRRLLVSSGSGRGLWELDGVGSG